MKKTVIFLVGFIVSLAVSFPAMGEEITIVGTGSGAAILRSIGEAYTQGHPGVTIGVPKSIGSGGGIKAVGTDENLIGRVARGLKDKEKPYGLTYAPYAKDPIVFMIHKTVGVTNLSVQQVCDIYSGTIANWKEVGGPDARIRVIRREDGDSSLSVLLETLPGFKDITITAKSKTALSDPETTSLVETKEGTIAFGTYGNATAADVQIVTINGVSPTDSAYPYVGTLALVFKEKNRTGALADFITFATSAASHDAIRAAGGSPL